MKKIVYDKLDITIPTGDSTFNQYINLRDGKCIGVKLIVFTGATPAHPINLGVENSQSKDVISATDFRDFVPAGGSYIQGLKPVDFDTRGDVNVYVKSVEDGAVKPLAADFKAQLIFAIDQEPCD